MTELKRSLGLFKVTLMGVGVILGAGIYALVGKAAALSGNAVWLSFILAALVAALTGLSYAELSSFITKAGGEYYYIRRAFGRFSAFLLTWLLIMGLAIAGGAVALGFGGYFNALFDINMVWTAVVLIILTSIALYMGTEQAAWIAVTCTILEITGILVVIAVGIPEMGSVNYFELATDTSGVIAAGALIFFAYIGFDEIVQLAEESKRPEKIIPRAILLSIFISTVLYVLVAIAVISVLPWESLSASNSPLADVVAKSLGQEAFFLLSTIALFSTGNTVLLIMLAAARLLYGMAESGSMPSLFAAIHRKNQTPHKATFAIALVAIFMVLLLQKIEIIASLTNFAFFTTFLLVNAAVIVLRFKEPSAKRIFRIPFSIAGVPIIPVLAVLSIFIMMLNVGWDAFFMGCGMLALGIVVYVIMLKTNTESKIQ